MRNTFMEWFGLSIPILQAPIGGAATPRLVIEVGRAGGMGSLALTWTPYETSRDRIAEIKAANVPFFINFVLRFGTAALARGLAGQAQEALGGGLRCLGVWVQAGGLRNFRRERAEREAGVRRPGRRIPFEGVGSEEVSQGLLATTGSAVSRTAHWGRGSGEAGRGSGTPER